MSEHTIRTMSMGTGKLKICKEDRGIQPLTERKEYANSYRVNVAERVLNAYEVRNLIEPTGHALENFIWSMINHNGQ